MSWPLATPGSTSISLVHRAGDKLTCSNSWPLSGLAIRNLLGSSLSRVVEGLVERARRAPATEIPGGFLSSDGAVPSPVADLATELHAYEGV